MSWTLPDDTRAHNPGLASLFDHLQSHLLDPTGMSIDVADELKKAKYNMDAKRAFLEASALHETLEQFRFAPNSSLTPLQQQIRDITDNVLTQVELSMMQSAEEGIDEAAVDAEVQVQKQLDSLSQVKEPLIKTIEDALQARASEIVLVHSTLSPSSSISMPLQGIVRETESQIEILEQWRTKAITDKIRHNQTLTALFNTLYKSVNVFWEMTQAFKIQHQLEKDLALQHYFDAVIQSTLLNLQVLEGQLAMEVYDPKTIESLLAARNELVQRHESLQRDLSEKDSLLLKYQSVGKDFSQIVAAYEEVKKQIEIVLGDIQHLQQTQ
ncbi:hypothetical protein BGZ73_005175 [Actinomortierella ambigua]|nr:hypothetical protein BGZ73_005175 [Actinomortierella ambigua]